MITKFKVGDKVERTKNTYDDMEPGDIGTISGVGTYDGHYTLKEFGGHHSEKALKLIQQNWKEVLQ